MLPKTLALVDDDSEYVEFLAQYLREQGTCVSTYADGSDLLAEPGALDHDFFILDLMLPGVDGLELIKILRRRTRAGILVVSGQLAPDVFKNIVNAGADMYLAKPVQFEQVLLVVKAVQRRVAAGVLSAGHARALLGVVEASAQDRLAGRVVAEGISVRALEEIVALGDHEDEPKAPRRKTPTSPALLDLADRLSDLFDTRVKVDLGRSKGKITIEYASLEDLDRIIGTIDPSYERRHDDEAPSRQIA